MADFVSIFSFASTLWLGIMPRLGIGLLLLAMAPIVVVLVLQSFAGYDARVAASSLILGVVVLVMTMKFCGVFDGFLYFLLPRKRAIWKHDGDSSSSDDGGNRTSSSDDSRSKKRRVGARESTARISGGDNSVVIERGEQGERAVSMALRDADSADIDEDLHSRQLAVYGRDTMRRLFASNVLVSGMQGLGCEIAKNLILAGVKSVTLYDEGKVELWDLSANFVFSESDVGKNKALACVQKLQELNNAVIVQALTTKLTKEQLSGLQAVVFTDISIEKAIEFNNYCHNHQPPIAFIKSEVRGLFNNVFCDFGPEFTVVEFDGEEPHMGIIASISNDSPALVSCVDDERLEFQDGDLVVFSEVQGMAELNDGKPRKRKNSRPYSFTLEEDTKKFGAYEKGGIVTR